MTFVTNDAPPTNLLAGRAVFILPLWSLLGVIRHIRGKRGVRGDNDAVGSQNRGVAFAVGAVICVYQARLF